MKRGIIEDEVVRKALNDAECRWNRAKDAWEAVTLVIALDPTAGTSLTESGKTRAITYQGSRSNGMPTITVIYEDHDPYLLVRDAKFSEPEKYEPYLH
jgi:hypothetical protein